jgi:hypothetical protein
VNSVVESFPPMSPRRAARADRVEHGRFDESSQLDLTQVVQQVRERQQRRRRIAQVPAGDVRRRAAGRIEHRDRARAVRVERERRAVPSPTDPISPHAASDRKSPYSLGVTITA